MNVAVVGSGIAGLSAAWHLAEAGVRVSLYEQNARLGGHTHSHSLPEFSSPVDSGFIVFNTDNYPSFSAWLELLDVPHQPSNMSFAVSDGDGFEYGTRSVGAAMGGGWPSRRHVTMWRELLRFYRGLHSAPLIGGTLGGYLASQGFSEAFIEGHIVPMCAALWSQPQGQSLLLDMNHVHAFMDNHNMLQLLDRPEWRVVTGGSSSYLEAFTARFKGDVRLQQPVDRIVRRGGIVIVEAGAERDAYDAVVIACHADEALARLDAPTAIEREVLGSFTYQPNRVYLHSDPRWMPKRRQCWSSWNVIGNDDGEHVVSYWMNLLQGLQDDPDVFVTLNPASEPDKVHWSGDYSHPMFTEAGRRAQSRWAAVNGKGTYFAGAYWGAGFHEDGFVSGMRCARALHEVYAHAA